MSSDLIPSPSHTQYHPKFDHEVFMVVFSVDGQGFKTDAARLCMHSEVVRSMLYGEDGKRGGELGLPREGTTENPWVINGCTAEAFANFMSWLNHASWETPGISGVTGYLDVLHITHMWRIRAGFDFAVNALEKENLQCAHRIHLARRYGIPQWVPLTVRVLLRLSFDCLTEADLNHLGYDVFIKLVLGKESIQQIRRQLGFFVPYPNIDDTLHCSTPKRCKQSWYDAWGRVLFRRIHHPSEYLALTDVLHALRSIDHVGMHASCKNSVINWVEECCPGLDKEEKAIRQIVASVQELTRVHVLAD